MNDDGVIMLLWFGIKKYNFHFKVNLRIFNFIEMQYYIADTCITINQTYRNKTVLHITTTSET